MKRFFAFVLTLCLVFSMLPANVVVATGSGTDPQNTPASHPNDAYGKGGHGDANVTWTAITNAAGLDKLATSGYYYLADNMTATKKQVLDGVNVTLCLGGKTLSVSSTLERHFELKNGAHLTICDCTASGTGDSYTAGTINPGRRKAGIALLYAKGNAAGQTATLTILDGIFDGNNTATGDYCGFIRMEAGSGTATASAKLDIQGGKFANRRGGRGGAILVSPSTNGVVTISNAQFVNCGSWQDFGGAITMETGSLTVNNCVFKNNKAQNDQSVNTAATLGTAAGGAIYAKNCSLDIQNSQFIGNEAAHSGAIFCMTATGTIKNCTFTGNKSNATGASVLHVESSSNITLDGCTITGNTHTAAPPSEGMTGAIDLRAESSQLTLKGKMIIDDNTEKDGTECNLRLAFAYNASKRANTTVKVDGLTADSCVNIFTAKDTREDANNLLVAGAGQTSWDPRWVRYDNKAAHIDMSGTTFSYANHVHMDVPAGWIAWGDDAAEKTSLPTANGNYYLVDNITASAYYTSDKTKEGVTTYTQADDITICLNHHNITAASGKPIFSLSHGANLTICDCTATGSVAEGTYDAGKLIPGACNGGAVYLWQKATTYPRTTFTMTGGIIDGNGITGGQGAALWAGAKEITIDLENCVIQNCTSNHSSGAGAVYASSEPTFSAENVRFYNNKCTGAAGYNGGGAIRLNNFASATLKNCVFDSNTSSSRGSAIYMYNQITTSKLVATDCKFVNNVAGDAVIMSQKGSMDLTRCTFQNNTSNITAGGGIAVNHEGSSTVTLDSCTITGNKAPNSADATMAATYTSGTSALILKGNTVVDGNTKKNGVEANIYICDAGSSGATDRGYLNVNGLTDGANVSVGTKTAREATALIQVATNGTQTSWEDGWVFYENNGLQVGYANNAFYFVGAHTHDDTPSVTWTPWTDSTKLPTASGYYYLTGPVFTGKNTVVPGTDVHLCLNGQTVTASGDEIYYYHHNGTTDTARTSLTICDCSDVANRGKLIPGTGEGGVFYASTKEVNMADGIDLYLKNVTIDGAGVTNNNNGVALWAGAAAVTMDLDDCLIQNCSTGKANGGGALYVSSGSTLRADNVVFKNNKSTNASGRGGAIYINAGNPNVTINKCTFEDNQSGGNGGAIYMATSSKVNITDSTFTGNTSGSYGAAIYTTANTAKGLTMTGCTLTGNTAAVHSTIHIMKGNTTLTDCVISNNISNRAAAGASAVYNEGSSTLLLDSCTITGNKHPNATNKDAAATYTTASSAIVLKGDTVVDDNTNKNGTEINIFVRDAGTGAADRGYLNVNGLTDGAKVSVSSESVRNVATDLIKVATGGTQTTWNDAWVLYENYDLYVTRENDVFKYIKLHTHEGEAEDVIWGAWSDDSTLPTVSGNYYLTKDIVLTNTAQMSITNGTKVNLCLNGFSIKFNENWKGGANYYVYAGGELNIINCQAKLDDKGHLECGNKNDPTNEQAGRLFGGRGLYGGAIYAKGTVSLNSVEFYDNQANVTTSSTTMVEGVGGAIRIQDGGKLTAEHCLFDSNKALANGGGAIGVVRGDAEIYLHDTVLTNNEAIGLYVKWDKDANNGKGAYVYSTTKEDGFAIDESKGRGGAILVNMASANGAGQKVTKDVVLSITGNSVIEGNYTNEETGNQGGAIALVTQSNTSTIVNNPNGKNLVATIGDDVQIKNNASRGVAGAIYVNHGNEDAAVQVNIKDDVLIDGNQSTKGNAGAMYVNLNSKATKGVEMNISDNVVISNNTAALGGGAMVVQQNGKTAVASVNISGKVQFVGNKTKKGSGGAIYMQSNTADVESKLNITGQVVFKNNETASGYYGGALYVQGCVVNATGTTFDGNKATYGGAIANAMGDATFNLHNITAKNNVAQNAAKTSGNGGFAYIKVYKKASSTAAQRTTKDVTMTISGNSVISSNSSYSSGCAIYMSRDFTKDGAPEGITCHLILKDKTSITKNSSLRTTGDGKGAITNDCSDAGKGVYSIIELSGNVEIDGNLTKTNAPKANICMIDTGRIVIGAADTSVKVRVYTSVDYNDPDAFVLLKEGVKLADTKDIGLIYMNAEPAVGVGYSNKKNTQFYFAGEYGTHTDHELCSCVLTEDKTCKHDDSMKWTAWIYSNRLPTTTGNYYLTGDVVITSNSGGSIGVFEVKNGQKVNLCLNGYSIKFSEKNNTKANYYAMQGSELSIINCKAKLDENNHLVPAAGGKITNGRGLYGGALYSKGKLTLIGIELSDNMVAATQSQNTIANSYGGAVRIQSGGILRATSCLFQDNKALYHGGAIAVGQGDAEVYLHDTVLKNNEAIGVYTKTEKVDGKSVTTVSPTKDDENFKLDEAKGRGGALYFNVSHLATAGNGITKTPVLEISGNTVFQGNYTNEETGGQGGAIAIANPKTNGFNLKVTIKDNVQIVDNTSRATGGAIYINQGALDSAPEITIQDNVKISGNKSLMGNGGAIYANITAKCKVPMILNITDDVQITDNATNFAGGAIFMQHTTTGKSAEITLSGNAKISGNKAGTTGGAIQLSGDFVLNITENAELSNNKAVTYAGAIYGIKHKNGEIGPEINISGGKIAKNEAMGKIDAKTGKLKDGYGGGIYIKQGVLNLTDGEISQNKANYGGGIFFNTTKFTFTKGTITKNYGKTNGGGVSSSQFSEMIMNGKDAVVSYNTSDGPAAGILIQGRKTSTLDGKSITKDYGSTLTMSNGKVYGNTAKSQGGGIYVSTESRAIIKGGSITGNTTLEQSGGGMYESKGEIIVYGGYFANNEGFHAGGAIQATEGKLHVYGGTFENNSCKYGGAIRTYNFTDTRIENATFVDNHVTTNGGAIALQSDTTIKNCTFKGNSAMRAEGATNETDGGALWVWGGGTYDRPSYEVSVEDCLFEENVADVLGGAAAVGHNCTLNISKTVFKNNKSNDRGGAVASVNAKTQRQKLDHLNIDECEFIANEAVNDGGAIYATWITETYLTNSTLTDNTAGRDGGAVYCRKQSDTWIDGCQLTGNAAGLRGAAIFAGDNIEMSNITVTDNKSGDTYAVYIDEGGYDGDSYVRALIKLYGDIIINNNQGSKPDMFIAKKALVNIGYQGLGDKTNFNVELAEGVLTNTLIGEYNYEGGNLKYTVTKGNRSLTDPEPIPVVEPEVDGTTPATDPTATGDTGEKSGLGVGGVIAISAVLVVAVIAVLAVVVVKKKKKAEEPAEDTVQE